MIYGEGEHLLNLLEFFRKYPDDKVHIDDYVNYCQMFYDYTEILESDYFQTHPAMAEALVLQLLVSILKGDQNYHYENIAFVCREDDKNINSYVYPQYPMEKIMDTMRPIYEKAVADAKAAATPEKRRGVGIAWGGFNVTEGGGDSAEVALELMPGNKIRKYDTWHAMGQGATTGSLVVTLEALKEMHLTPEDIQLIQNDPKTCPDTGMAGASRSLYMDGNATIIAANKLLAAMRKEDGTLRTYDEMKAEGIETKYHGRNETNTTPGLCRLDPISGIGDPTPAFTYCLNLAEVEVDTKTGKTTVLKFTCVDFVGRIGIGKIDNGSLKVNQEAIVVNHHDPDKKK